ncbi:MAG: N-acyl homoserine lactonase family protein [Solirubrobacterales bacterium]
MDEIATRTLTAPLPGGSPESSVSVRLFGCGELLAPPGYLYEDEAIAGKLRAFGSEQRGAVWVPLPVFLIEHPTAGLILVDTGPPASAAHDTKAAFGRLGAALYKVRLRPEQAIAAQLRAVGIEPSRIATVVMTHLHLDHAGSISEFPRARFVTTVAEWQAAHAGRAIKHGYVRKQYEHAFDFLAVDYDATDTNSFASFGRSFDLFGDGSITLVSTPGHTPGHQSVVARLGSREVLICGDAALGKRTLDEGIPPATVDDQHTFKRSLREIRAYMQMTPGALIIPGHDPGIWQQLNETYA